MDTTVPARSALSVHNIPFSGGLYEDGNGSLMIKHDPDLPRYVDGDVDEVDKNWERLLDGRYVMLEEKDASALPDYPAPVEMRGKAIVGQVEVLGNGRYSADRSQYPHDA